MTAARAIIKQSLRESNLITINADPTDAQLTEGLDKLNSLIASVFGFEAGTILKEWPVGVTGTEEFTGSWSRTDWELPPPNVRFMVSSLEPETITLPPFPNNGARVGLVDLTGTLSTHAVTLDANGKRIEGASSLIVNVDDADLEWFYDRGDWKRLTLLTLDDNLPFPIQFDTYFETMMATRMNPRYGRAMDAQTAASLQRSLGQLRATYRQSRSVRVDEGLLRTSRTGHGGIADDDASAAEARRDIWIG
jgi:hypothetical protein